MMGGWLPDDSKMRMDEKKMWRTYGINFGRTFPIWAKSSNFRKESWVEHGVEPWT